MIILAIITPMIVPLVLTTMIVIVAVSGDKLLTRVDNYIFKAIIDTTTHGSIGLLSWAVVVFSSNSIHSIKLSHCAEILVCGVIASLIDLDHFFAARSVRLQDALQLSRRPPFHSSSLLILVFFLFFLSAKVLKNSLLDQMSWIISVAGGSHHLRDGVRRGLWFPPFGSTPPLHHVIYLGSLAFLPHVVVFLMPNIYMIPKKTRYIIV